VVTGVAGTLDRNECQEIDMQRSENAVTFDFVCTSAGKRSTALAVVSGSFDSAYTVTTRIVAGESLPGRTMTTAGTWLGPCAAGDRPGDVVSPGLANGARLNILDLRNKARKCRNAGARCGPWL
jgi:hypothetical protein